MKIRHPEIYQGKKHPSQYFEGWYFRHTSKDKKIPLIVIPGVSYSNEDTHAFIQVITGIPQKTYYIQFDITEFNCSRDSFSFSIGSNTFSDKGIHLELDADDLSLTADLSYGHFTRIDRSPLCPNIMGFFAYLPFMECSHGVISLYHTITGNMNYNGSEISFDDGTGYIEKDWGSSFPAKYIWMQSNHFNKDTSLFLSIAKIPFMGMVFDGLIAILTVDSKQYRFATYNSARFKIEDIRENSIHIELEKGKRKLDIVVDSTGGHVLKAPRRGGMSDEITETLNADISIGLYENGSLKYKDTGSNLGFEMMWKE